MHFLINYSVKIIYIRLSIASIDSVVVLEVDGSFLIINIILKPLVLKYSLF